MPRKLTVILITATACSTMPQIAAASCTGNACSSFSFSNNKFTNKDKDLKIHLMGCIIKAAGTCGSPPTNFDVTIDPNASKAIPAPPASGGDVKVDIKTAVFVGALQQPRTQTLPSTNSVMTTISNQTDVPVIVKYRDVEGAEFAKEVKDHSPTSAFAVRMDANWKANPVKWSAFSGSKMCDSGAVAVSSSGTGTIEVTKCTKSCELSMDKKNCELERDLKATEETRKRRDQARTDLANARNEYNACMATASKVPIKVPFTDVCAALRDNVNKLITEILNDDKKLGEIEPGAPLRLETVVNTTPPPSKPQGIDKEKLQDMARKKLGGCAPDKPDNPNDPQGNSTGVFDADRAAGCTFRTNVGGGRK
jgi:hypothetical protein